ncbi:Metallo-dependent hydrolase [Gloeophyllum trabeum ATCC 11539]|uniref:Metallo-dependent hydrolase n=1 Tax=Gloeophyllum trabeum (strain ATCC 11539 / FP-39264 / Madison 617) TaxID=670483 RepID=S7QES4_GLOTA|nr:Metallo-dependent hydrolase [Gloeophyllum trabeum ATCC 11539]EPQ58321.1 Metallo-dependent hydrolase [Gloeophyllum trabeum ATCC 11539]
MRRTHLGVSIKVCTGREGAILNSHLRDFPEALRVTSKAKFGFAGDLGDLYARGRHLLRESIQCGVTSMRAHVEVDRTVGFACVDVGLRLKEHFKDTCDIQLAAFAQDPLYAAGSKEPSDNLRWLEQAAAKDGVSVIGSAPYVEPSLEQAKMNIIHILDLAEAHTLHVDFHLDYNADPATEPLVWFVLDQLRARRWTERIAKGLPAHITIGHATRLSLFSAEEWQILARSVIDLPISFVALPQSDLYMMGRTEDTLPGLGPRRYTLNVPRLRKQFRLNIAMSINNVQNAFTPQGSVDPLALCPLGVAAFQAGTPRDCMILLEAVSRESKRAIGDTNVPRGLVLSEGDPADFVLLHANNSAHSAALNPCWERTTIKGGAVVGGRRAHVWTV